MGKPIYYSLGNFQFRLNSEQQLNSSLGMMVELELPSLSGKTIPVSIDENSLPNLLNPRESKQFDLFLSDLNDKFTDRFYSFKWYQKASKGYLLGEFKAYFIRVKKYGVRHLLMMIRTAISYNYTLLSGESQNIEI